MIPVPREHGAWAMLLAALALAWAHPWVRGWPAALLTLVFAVGFALQEPLRAVAQGRREPVWRAWLLVYGVLLLAGVSALAVLGHTRALLPAATAGALLTAGDLMLRRRNLHRTFALRLLGMAGLTLALPAMLVAVHPDRTGYAVTLWTLTFLYAATRLLAVRARNEWKREGKPGAWRKGSLAAQGLLYAIVAAIVLTRVAHPTVLLAFVPGTVAALRPPADRGLRSLGWREVAHLAWFVTAVLGSYHLAAPGSW